jgi:large subunit ribosomal protein L17
LATSLILTEREDEYYDDLYEADGKTPVSAPKQKGRVVTTLHKAKEVRSLVEKCVTIARNVIKQDDAAAEQEAKSPDGEPAERNSAAWESWRKSVQWTQWAEAKAPGVAARRRVFDILRNKEAVAILFEEIAPRFEDRPGGYTRILKLAKPRLGDAGAQAILEFVGRNDRNAQVSEMPAFDTEEEVTEEEVTEEEVTEEEVTEEEVTEEEVTEATETSEDDAEAINSSEESDGEAKQE